ncbi:hypothetical protein A1Q_3782 [Vibrio campbellii HY01]|nr:hypothetical protein A1Q_3760 [Vibrio campbellii HY01]EDL70753.1 hypothetical protein A1Q_3782 [Vibrio campbellii HY01]
MKTGKQIEKHNVASWSKTEFSMLAPPLKRAKKYAAHKPLKAEYNHFN